jgi:hypothetical protein
LRHVQFARGTGETSQTHDGFEYGELRQGTVAEELAAAMRHRKAPL